MKKPRLARVGAFFMGISNRSLYLAGVGLARDGVTTILPESCGVAFAGKPGSYGGERCTC
jgi:hypothetical protein